VKNFVLILFLGLILLSCTDPNVESGDKTTEELLTNHGWQLDRYTDLQGNRIPDGALKDESAKLLYHLIFDFKASSEVRGLAKTTKLPLERGTWKYYSNTKTLIVEISGFAGEFDVVEIGRNSMILRVQQEGQISGVGSDVMMVFSRFDL
jgi:hypothetical protein